MCSFTFSIILLKLTLTFGCRQPTKRSKLSLIPPSQHYAMLYRPSKSSMQHGKNSGVCQKQDRLEMRWMQGWQKLTSTMRKPQRQMHILSQCVYIFIIFYCKYKLTKFIPVLHPKRKMRYFKKNWSEELQKEVVRMAETVVCYSS
jgi:hypothetical protein